MTVKIVELVQVFVEENIMGMRWCIDNDATKDRDIKEILDEHLKDGWEIKGVGNNKYILFKEAKE